VSTPHSVAGRAAARIVFVAGLCGVCALSAWAVHPPALLLYGFQAVPGFYPPQLWADFADRLSGSRVGDVQKIWVDAGHAIYRLPAADDEHRDVFIGDYAIPYEPTLRDLRYYAVRVDAEIAWITENGQSPHVDVIGHSMGGLIARCYIETSDFEAVLGEPGYPDYGTTYRGDVRTLITLAAPHHGAEFADVPLLPSSLSRQLAPGSTFLSLLNDVQTAGDSTLDPTVRYVSMAGQTCLGCGIRRDVEDCRRECVEDGKNWDGSDLVIWMSSAFLAGAENVACIGMDHVDMHTEPTLADALVGILDGNTAPAVIYSSPDLEVLESSGE
jgi:pimeloyl-ACP methyl ester carboxylesterase